jgi:hypothetical protein
MRERIENRTRIIRFNQGIMTADSSSVIPEAFSNVQQRSSFPLLCDLDLYSTSTPDFPCLTRVRLKPFVVILTYQVI